MSSYADFSEFELISLMQQDDELAFTEVYDRFNVLLFVYAFRKLQDKDAAQDVVQEVFEWLWSNRSTFQLKSTLSGFLYRSVLNRILNIFRHKEFDRSYVETIQKTADQYANEPEKAISDRDILRVIEREIAILPPRMKEVFDLRRKEYLSNKEIALRLDISEHTVATHIKKAMRVLRLKLGPFLFSVLMILMQ